MIPKEIALAFLRMMEEDWELQLGIISGRDVKVFTTQDGDRVGLQFKCDLHSIAKYTDPNKLVTFNEHINNNLPAIWAELKEGMVR